MENQNQPAQDFCNWSLLRCIHDARVGVPLCGQSEKIHVVRKYDPPLGMGQSHVLLVGCTEESCIRHGQNVDALRSKA